MPSSVKKKGHVFLKVTIVLTFGHFIQMLVVLKLWHILLMNSPGLCVLYFALPESISRLILDKYHFGRLNNFVIDLIEEE